MLKGPEKRVQVRRVSYLNPFLIVTPAEHLIELPRPLDRVVVQIGRRGRHRCAARVVAHHEQCRPRANACDACVYRIQCGLARHSFLSSLATLFERHRVPAENAVAAHVGAGCAQRLRCLSRGSPRSASSGSSVPAGKPRCTRY